MKNVTKSVLWGMMVVCLCMCDVAFAQNTYETEILNYIDGHVWPVTGLPQSYYMTEGYWQNVYSNEDTLGYARACYDPGRQQERFIMQYGLNLYDGACYQIAMSLSGTKENLDRAAYHTRRLRTNKTEQWGSTRAYTKTNADGSIIFEYGDNLAQFGTENRDKSFFFRLISELYQNWDPLLGTNLWTQWQDWKPVTGENAWCAYIGPLQTAWMQYCGRVPWTDPAVLLGYDMLDAVDAMQNEIGAVYHVPTGVFSKPPSELSNENNFSMYAGLRMFKQIMESIQGSGGNLVRNPGFEDEGDEGVNDALYWRWGGPDYHASDWGNIAREQWDVHSGLYLNAIRGTWAGDDYGGCWQEVPVEYGMTNDVSVWFKADDTWTAGMREMKLEYLNGDYWQITAYTNDLTTLSSTWSEFTMHHAVPAEAVWARLVILASGMGVDGSLQFDDVAITASPTWDVAGAISRASNILDNMDAYFENHLYNTNDGVFFTGGNYYTNSHEYVPYVFDPRWIGGPYRGSNTFLGTTIMPPTGTVDYMGTNMYTGYNSVDVDLHISRAADQVNIYPEGGFSGTGYPMTKLSDTHFRYTFQGVDSGYTIEYTLAIVIGGVANLSDAASPISWTVSVDDPPAPYTSICSNLFAVDCQTWGMAVLGAEYVDTRLKDGNGQPLGIGTAYDIWQRTKQYGGYYNPLEPDLIRGVGFSDINSQTNSIFSAEWTFGAIIMCRNLARDYYRMGYPDYAKDLERDAEIMRIAIDQELLVDVPNIEYLTTAQTNFTMDPYWYTWTTPITNYTSGKAYLYCNKRYEIPFGWWANYLPCMCSSAWSIMDDRDYNPFVLGGTDTNLGSRLIPWLEISDDAGGSIALESRSTQPGKKYELQTCNTLTSPVWTSNMTITASIEPYVWSNVPTPTDGQYYRLVPLN